MMLCLGLRLFASSLITRINSTWLASESISALNIIFFYAFHLLLAEKTIFLCLLFISRCFFHFFLFDSSISDKNARLILKLAIPIDVPMTSFNNKTETSLPASDKAGNLSIVIQLLKVLRISLCHWCLQSIFFLILLTLHFRALYN